jgi:GMP synthase (glutamine-hydrolysing)
MSHGDEALELPAGFQRTAATSNALAGIVNEKRRIWAVQFHPEVHHTPLGPQILKNFVFNLQRALRLDPGAFYREHGRGDSREGGQGARDLRALRRGGLVGGGGAGAQGDREPVDVRLCEQRSAAQERVCECAEEPARQAGAEHCAVDASERFLAQLAGVTDPETKRKRIGAEFIAVFDDEAKRIAKETGGVDWLVQGTLYPDVIESAA